MGTSEAAKGKIKKGKVAADPPVAKKPKSREPQAIAGTSTSASGASLDSEDDDDDDDDEGECRLAWRMRSGMGTSQVPRTESAKSGTADSGRSRGSKTLEDGVNMVPDPMTGFGVVYARGTVVANGFSLGPQFSSGELKDAQDANTAKNGGPLKGGGALGNILDDVRENVDLDAPRFVKAMERFMQQCKEMYDHALSRLNKEFLCHEKELERLTLGLRESKAYSARKEKESGELRAALERALREKAALAEQRDSLIGQKETEILELKELNGMATSEMASTHDLLQNAREEVVALTSLKSEIEGKAQVDAQVAAKGSALAKASTFEMQIRTARANGSARANMIARLESELSKAKAKVVNARAEAVMSSTRVDQKAVAYSKSAATARAELRGTLGRASSSKEYVKCKSWKEILEKIHARGFDLSEDIEQAKAEEYDAKFFLSDAKDGEDRGVGP
ncbi:uncharacterized protein [Nicotiana sylvestris]|uniref:uncharacterized protein n=1 Tax=Nicotiana sylvestris TaxID=4096 RepID=UPI00388C7EDE